MVKNFYEGINEEYIYESAERFNKYENKKKYNTDKNNAIKTFGIIIIILALFNYFGLYIKNDLYKMKFLLEPNLFNIILLLATSLLVIFTYIIITVYIKGNQIKEILGEDYEDKLFKIQHIFKNKEFLLFLSSPDYFYSKKSKECILNYVKKNRNTKYKSSKYEIVDENEIELSNHDWVRIQIDRKFLIEWSNWSNVSFSFMNFLFVFFLYLIQLFLEDIVKLSVLNYIMLYFWIILSFFIAYRIISRSIEIIIAFYKDVVRVSGKAFYSKKQKSNNKFEIIINSSEYYNGFKYSLLRPQGRLSLAIHTLVEFFILFASIYTIFSITITGFLGEHSKINILQTIIYSFSLGVFNVSFDKSFILLQSIFHSLQLISSCILILLSVSHYLNGSSELKEESFEYKFYKALFRIKVQKNFEEKLDNTVTSCINLDGLKIYYYEKDFIYDKQKKAFKYNDDNIEQRIIIKIRKVGHKIKIDNYDNNNVKYINENCIYLFKDSST
ncbi:hypothetical protein [Lysinibacillus sp. NPDC059133]|uniref:hypothetical protein n=1 Tax=Lysinibacillus sp. NPDC059133 TaxID=3346737 RepID=UPI0036AA29C5